MSDDWHGKAPDPERERLERDLAEAQAEQDAYQRALALVRPYMEGTGRTLEEALEAMRADGIDPGWPLPQPEGRA